MAMINFLEENIDLNPYLFDSFDANELKDIFSDVNISDGTGSILMNYVKYADHHLVCDPLQQSDEELFSLNEIFIEEIKKNDPTATLQNSQDKTDEANDYFLPEHAFINEDSFMLPINNESAAAAVDDHLFCLLDSGIIPEQNEESILQEYPAQFVDVQSGTLPHEWNVETIDSSLNSFTGSSGTDNDAVIQVTLTGMSVHEQPKPDLRARYGSDGPRFLPGSRKKPMSITLPNLKAVSLDDGYRWGIVLTMVTDDENPQGARLLHVNELVYRTPDAIQITPQSTFIPLDSNDLETCHKKFPRASIVCTKFDKYTFDITDFEQGPTGRQTRKYVPQYDISQMTKTAVAKQFVKEYRLESYRFIFQLAVEKDGEIIIFPSQCETHLVTEKRQPKVGNKAAKDLPAQKRKADEDPSEKPSRKKSKSSPVESSCSTNTHRSKRSANRPKDQQ